MKKIVVCYVLETNFLSELEYRLTQITMGAKECGMSTYAHIRDEQNWEFHNEPIKVILSKSFEKISSSDIVFLDLTTHNPTNKRTGLNIEAGYAKALGKTIVALWHISERPNMTTDLADFEISYKKPEEIKSKVLKIFENISK